MKLVSLNTWMGIVREPLLEFLRTKKNDTDVFCFQEMLKGGAEEGAKMWKDATEVREHELLPITSEILSNFTPFWHETLGDWAGLAMFIHKDTEILEEGEVWVHGSKTGHVESTVRYTPRNIQYAKIRVGEKPITIINFHGLWSGGEKTDNEERINQSKRIVEFMKGLNNEFLICGDFNLEPNTESLKILEDFGLRNLIKENGITSTRTSFYKKPVKFADYTLVSKGVQVKKFEVLPDEVSDHSAMYLEFE
jgi:endonuclease/exonuclease/phosphatase family metal-dependent hydrolase